MFGIRIDVRGAAFGIGAPEQDAVLLDLLQVVGGEGGDRETCEQEKDREVEAGQARATAGVTHRMQIDTTNQKNCSNDF